MNLRRFVAVYLRLHLKICTLQTRYKKCSVQIDLLLYVFTHSVGHVRNRLHDTVSRLDSGVEEEDHL